MLFRTHILFGVFFWLVLMRAISMPFWILGFVLAGVMFVDLDSYNSRIAKRFWFFSWIFRHRGVLHSLIACIFLSLIIGSFSLWAGFGFFVGYVSHLVMDSLTLAGVALFWPLKFKIRGFVKSGGWVEDVLFVILLVLNIILVYLLLMT